MEVLLLVLLVSTAVAKECTEPSIWPCPQDRNYDFSLSPRPLLISGHPESVTAPTGANISFNCTLSNQRHIINGSLQDYSILWRFNGSHSSQYPSHWSVAGPWPHSTLTLSNITTLDNGYYECMVRDGLIEEMMKYVSATVSKRAWLNKAITGQVGGVPVLGIPHKELTYPTGLLGTHFIDSSCQVTGDKQTLYWYKDGVDITNNYDPSTNELKYSNVDGVHGVYQCFVENNAGSDYFNIRVLPENFADPPSNFSCVAVDREDDPQKVKLVLSWEPPLLVADGISSDHNYVVQVLRSCYNVGQSTCAELPLSQDADIRCSVYLDTDPSSGPTVSTGPTGGRATVNNFNTARQRRYNDPRNLSVECNTTHHIVTLPNTEIVQDVCLSSLNLQAVCVYQGQIYTESLELDEYDTDCDGRSYGLSISSPDPESVCVFTGNYSYPFNFTSDVVLSVDPVTCLVTPPTLLHCTPSTLHWRGTHSTNFTGLCFTPHLHQVTSGPITLSPDDVYVHSDLLPVGSVCTYTSVNESVQCVVSDPPSSTLPPYTSETSDFPTPSSQDGVLLVTVWVTLAIVVISVLLVAMVMGLVCTLIYYRRHKEIKAKEQMHILASVVEKQLDSSEYPPVDPFTFNEVHGSSVSLDTQVDTLWDSKQPTHKLMNQFLETPLSPSQRVLALLTEQFLSSTSSSGYGTSNIEGEPDYYQTKLKDFTNSSRYVKEYFEHDPEGYVHMVPSRTQ